MRIAANTVTQCYSNCLTVPGCKSFTVVLGSHCWIKKVSFGEKASVQQPSPKVIGLNIDCLNYIGEKLERAVDGYFGARKHNCICTMAVLYAVVFLYTMLYALVQYIILSIQNSHTLCTYSIYYIQNVVYTIQYTVYSIQYIVYTA